MRSVSWQFVGRCWEDWYDDDEIIQSIEECTSEYDGFVDAIVLDNVSQSVGKIPLMQNNKLYLAVFTITFVVLLDASVLDVKELIFMHDNEIKNCDD
jgi:hypothetical protein